MTRHVVVIGAGIAGFTAAVALANAGARVTQLTKGIGGLQLGQGSIDVLGYLPSDPESVAHDQLVTDPFEAFDRLPDAHPYRLIGAQAVRDGLDLWRTIDPNLDWQPTNRRYPTALGALRPTCGVFGEQASGRAETGTKYLVVGIDQIKDFQAELIAGNLNRHTDEQISARSERIWLPSRPGEFENFPVTYARNLDGNPELVQALGKAIAPLVQPGEVVALPAVLGLNDPSVFTRVSELVGAPVFEITSQPPSVPGMRMNQHLTSAVKTLGVRWGLGTEVVGWQRHDDGRVEVLAHVAGRTKPIVADAIIHCGGGFESGTLKVDSHAVISESVLGLPVSATDADELIHGDYWGRPQDLFKVGVVVDEQMRVLDPATGSAVHPMVFAAGGILAGADRWHELSGDGIAIGSAIRAAEAAMSEGESA